MVANKLDLAEAGPRLAAFRRARAEDNLETVAVSARERDGVADLVRAVAALLPGAAELGRPSEPAGVVVHRFDSMRDGFAVEREGDAFRVRGRRIERVVAQTDFEVDESAERFQRDLARLGIDSELRRAGRSSRRHGADRRS